MTKRYRRRTARTGNITPDAVAAFQGGDRTGLHRELGLKPWQPSPLDVNGACPWPPGSAGQDTWDEAIALRAELETFQGVHTIG
jgi:hypothetical protein